MTRRITDAAEVASFRATAKSFCDLVATHKTLELPEFLRATYPALASLMAAALALPEVSQSPELVNDPDSTNKYFELAESLRGYIGKYDVWHEVFDPYVEAPPITFTLSNALAEVCEDITPGLQEWPKATAGERRAYVWDWTFKFQIDWGHNSIDAMRAIHALLFGHNIDEPDHEWPPRPHINEDASVSK